jgi:hypothetical protein
MPHWKSWELGRTVLLGDIRNLSDADLRLFKAEVSRRHGAIAAWLERKKQSGQPLDHRDMKSMKVANHLLTFKEACVDEQEGRKEGRKLGKADDIKTYERHLRKAFFFFVFQEIGQEKWDVLWKAAADRLGSRGITDPR